MKHWLPEGGSIEKVDSELNDADASPPEYEIATYPADFTLQVLSQKWFDKKIIIPEFQRQFVWTQTQASKLIESFLLGLPVPAIFLYTERKTEKFMVIDGQQRLKSIFYYFQGFFGDETASKRRVFRLIGLSEKSRWANKTFADLQDTDAPSAEKLENAVMRSFVVKQLDPSDDTSIYHIFERLNTGGTLLKGQEIRNCIYSGPFNDLLKQLNQNDQWREVFGRKTPDKRMRDVELILRFFALFEDARAYKKPMKDFLSHFMVKHKSAEDPVLQGFRSLFEDVVRIIRRNLGAKPFHIRAGLNASVFDSVFVAVARKREDGLDGLKVRYTALVKDDGFAVITSSATTDVEVVAKRLAMAMERL